MEDNLNMCKETEFNQMVMATKSHQKGILRKYSYLGKEELDDLSQVMLEAIFDAVSTFDFEKGASLKTYCCKLMDWRVQEYLSKNSRLISLSVDDYQARAKVLAKMEELPYASLDRIAKETGYSIKMVRKCLTPLSTSSLDQPVTGEDDDISLGDIIPDESVEQDSYFKGYIPYLDSALSHLSNRDEDIIRKSFGIGDVKYTLEDIAKAYSVTHQMISKYKAKALIKLKQELLKATFHESL